MNRSLMLLLAGAVALTGCSASASTVTKERVTDRAGVIHTTEVLKSGKRLETIRCADFDLLDESFKPQAVTYAANYGPMGKARPTETVSGVESYLPVVVQDCRARPGDHFVSRVQSAMRKKNS